MTAMMPFYIPLGTVEKGEIERIEWSSFPSWQSLDLLVSLRTLAREKPSLSLILPLGFSLHKQQQVN